jgi:hypothetical protein
VEAGHAPAPAAPMRRAIVVLTGVLLVAAFGLSACSDYTKDIDAVRQDRTVTQDQTNDALALQLAGARGKVEWVGDRPDKYKDNEYIVAVTAKIERITRAGAKRQIELQFIRNRQNQQISFEQLTIDGQPQGLVGGALNLLLMQLE